MVPYPRVEEEEALPQVIVTATAEVAAARAKEEEGEGAAPLSVPFALST
jgi:hypothetical protein